MISKQDHRAKYQQLRIRQRDLEKRIAKEENGKDTRKLSKLYREATQLRDEISEVARKLG